jgi:hypothetical protein
MRKASAAVLSVVTRLAAPDCSFLRIMKIDDLDDNSIVDIGHEALVRRWSKLKGGGETDWIREEQDDGEKYRDLVRIARAHSTIPDAELLAYEAWWARRKPTATWAKRYSKAGKDSFAQVGEALARSRQECEEGERERAAAARAEIEAREARLRLATAEAQMEAARARASVAEERAKVSAAEVAVHLQKVRMTRIAAADPGQRAGFGVWSGDGKDIVTSTFFEGQPSVWNAFSGKIDADLENVVAAGLKPDRLLSSLAMSASGKFIAEGDSKGAITVLRTDSGEVEAPLVNRPGFAGGSNP